MEQILYGAEARRALLLGAKQLYDVARVTLGPAGRNVVLNRHFGTPLVTNDGATIAKEIFLADIFENMGARLVAETSIKTNTQVGDGTTTAIVLTYSMMEEGVRLVEAGFNPVLLRKGMQEGLKIAEDAILMLSKPMQGKEDIARIASISSGDEELGRLMADTMAELPPECVMEVQESNGIDVTCEVVEGMQFDRGYLTSHMITDSQRMEAVLHDPLILLTDQKINSIDELLPVLEQVKKEGKSLFVVSDTIETEPLAALIVNRMRGKISLVCAKAPSFGERKKDLLEDMAALTGGKVISKELGMQLADTTLSHLGRADKVVCTHETSTIIGGKGKPECIASRISQIREALALAEYDYDRLKLSERLSKLQGGIAVIKVGAPTEVEMQEKKLRIEDAVHSIEAAKGNGVVPGGATALIRGAQAVTEVCRGEDDEAVGAKLVAKALTKPLMQIAENGGEEGSVILTRVMKEKKKWYGYDGKTKEICDLTERGILDPADVVITALRNAVSVASTVIMAESLAGEMEPPKGKSFVRKNRS